jgi:hypothetical protein
VKIYFSAFNNFLIGKIVLQEVKKFNLFSSGWPETPGEISGYTGKSRG